ncbi:uncharacterized protein G2W53_004240 [Senna tora]|uniref:Uncharacterized protein n=1 Tax=Senna tora TaxID=362788 RepID=A0A834XCK4_9FABA|nr:uncharacterized protein G2W53_004240 [Senna tora]
MEIYLAEHSCSTSTAQMIVSKYFLEALACLLLNAQIRASIVNVCTEEKGQIKRCSGVRAITENTQ